MTTTTTTFDEFEIQKLTYAERRAVETEHDVLYAALTAEEKQAFRAAGRALPKGAKHFLGLRVSGETVS